MLSRLDIRKLAHPLMQQLAEFGQCMVSLGSRDRLSMIYIDAVRGSAAVPRLIALANDLETSLGTGG
jgi:DNA-binding IclR family transcriptional regulator